MNGFDYGMGNGWVWISVEFTIALDGAYVRHWTGIFTALGREAYRAIYAYGML